MKHFRRFAGLAALLTLCSGCESTYVTNLLGSSGSAIVGTVLSEFFRRLFQQI